MPLIRQLAQEVRSGAAVYSAMRQRTQYIRLLRLMRHLWPSREQTSFLRNLYQGESKDISRLFIDSLTFCREVDGVHFHYWSPNGTSIRL